MGLRHRPSQKFIQNTFEGDIFGAHTRDCRESYLNNPQSPRPDSTTIAIMPPFIARKRHRSRSPSESPRVKPSLSDTADKLDGKAALEANKAFLEKLDGSDSDTSLSDASSIDFEDVIGPPSAKKRKIEHDDAEDDIDWEDALQEEASTTQNEAPEPSGDLLLNLGGGAQVDTTFSSDKKKGPSKIERQIRTTTHCMHVQFLLFHNLVRNGWVCDKEVQEMLVEQLPPGVKKEVEKWKMASGMDFEPTDEPCKASTQKLKGKSKGKRSTDDIRSQRDWGKPAERQERGAPNMSSADPVIRLLKVLAAYWKKRFTITAPGLRKQGYKPIIHLESEITSFKKEKHDMEKHGERVAGLEGFRKCAKTCEGSRDTGVQLFAALIRGLGIEARLVASLQPIGFGWSKAEEASLRKKKKAKKPTNSNSDDDSEVGSLKSSKSSKPTGKRKPQTSGKKTSPIDISESEQDGNAQSDDDSVIDVTPSTPRKKPNMNYDRDLNFPTYWIEAISPITNEVYPVDPFMLHPAVATNGEHLAAFEPRGAKADKAKQVFAYVVAYSSDGTAKEVTTRYLKRHMWPGRTKGVRMPVEKVPVYNKRGKIKYHEDYDWFKTVISGYKRPHNKRTAVDDLEDEKDLKAVKPEKKEKKEGEETLQGYKTSANYALERHLRREEAIHPDAKPVKTFKTGKGDNVKEEPVFLRKDVMICRTGESWHKEGRQIKVGEKPMKMVPVRAVTMNRKREVEEAQREGGERLMQGMYCRDQTDWIIPPPIENGVIPKNAFGNMDCYVPTMIPKGAVHIPLRSTMKICKRLGIDYAEAVTGFEFGKRIAVPVITGVVVAAENENMVIDEWEKDEEERRRKEDEKREKAALAAWRKMIMGLRIYERVRNEYGDDEIDLNAKEENNPFTRRREAANDEASRADNEDTGGGFIVDAADEEGGGFLPEGYRVPNDTAPYEGGGFLPDASHDEDPVDEGDDGGGEFMIDNEDTANTSALPIHSPDPANVSESDKEEDTPISSPTPPPPKKRGRPAKTSTTTIPEPKPTKRAKATPKSGRKASANGVHISPLSDEKPSLSPKPLPQSKPKTPAQKAPTRTSARNSAGAVKSRYFERSSEDEEEDSDDGEEFEPEVVTKKVGRKTR